MVANCPLAYRDSAEFALGALPAVGNTFGAGATTPALGDVSASLSARDVDVPPDSVSSGELDCDCSEFS